jgi:tRNA 2-thiocytidine biosynthesis protein TtcA
MKDTGKRMSRKISRALLEYEMLAPGDKVLVAVSGGKDSMTLLYHLLEKSGSFPVDFTVGAVHIQTDFCNCGKKSGMETMINDWGAPYIEVKVPVIARLQPGKKMNCYWCSTQRRMELMKHASENGYTKIALGHHQDDILETFFMNMAYKSELSTMMPVLKYDKFPHTVIRPLALVKEREIVEFAEEKKISNLMCTCPYGTRSKRRDMKKVLEFIAEGGDYMRDNIYRAMSHPVPAYLPGFMQAMEENGWSEQPAPDPPDIDKP